MAARLTTYVVVGIVAATLIAGLIAGAQRDDDGPVDLIIQNGRVFTADRSATMAEAIAVRGNQVLRVGSNREVARLRRPQTAVIDANGAAVVPGFNDAHLHFIAGGLALEEVDVRDATAVPEILDRIRAGAEAATDRPWILGRGWTPAMFPDGPPTRHMLDDAVADRPAYLLSSDGQAAWVNTRALKVARLSRRTPDPVNGSIVRDSRTGEPTGVLKGTAIALVGSLVPQPSREDRARALRTAIDEAHRHGITSVQNADGNEQDFELYDAARKASELKVRVHSALTASWPLSDADFDRLDAVRKKYPDDPVFKVGALKIFLDGTTETHTAAMLEPYASRPVSAGEPAIAPDDLNRMVRLADAHGWQIMTHAAGDRAVRMALDAYQHAARSNLLPARGRRHRVEHAETIAEADIRRFGALGVLASMQPLQGSPSTTQLDMRDRALGPERAARGWLYRSVAVAGGRLAFGSDWPSSSINPLAGIHAAVTRTTVDGEPEGGWIQTERLKLDSALKAYTSGAAWASFDEQRKGTLAPGMLADIVVLSNDIFKAPSAKLASTTVEVTIFDGKIVYRRGARPSTTD